MKKINLLQKKDWCYSLYKNQKTDFEIEKIIFKSKGIEIETTNVDLKIETIDIFKNQIVGKNLIFEDVKIETIEKTLEHEEHIETKKQHWITFEDANGNQHQRIINKTYFKKTQKGQKITQFAEKYKICHSSARKIIEDFKL